MLSKLARDVSARDAARLAVPAVTTFRTNTSAAMSKTPPFPSVIIYNQSKHGESSPLPAPR